MLHDFTIPPAFTTIRLSLITVVLSIGAGTGCKETDPDVDSKASGPPPPPSLPERAVFKPVFVHATKKTTAGCAFLAVRGEIQTPVLLTARHLLGHEAGLWQEYASDELDAAGIQLTLRDAFSNKPLADCRAKAIALPSAADFTSDAAAGNIAAFATENTEQLNHFVLSSKPIDSSEGSAEWLWIAAPADGTQELHPARVFASRGGVLYYRLQASKLDLQACAGAPVVNAAGEAVAIHLGGAQDADGSTFGIANPASRFLQPLTSALTPPAAPGMARAQPKKP